jgi:hypothetical protein
MSSLRLRSSGVWEWWSMGVMKVERASRSFFPLAKNMDLVFAD